MNTVVNKSAEALETREIEELRKLYSEAAELDAANLTSVIRRRWKTLLIVPLVAGLAGLALSFTQSTVYTADATVLNRAAPIEAALRGTPVNDENTARLLRTDAAVAERDEVRLLAESQLGFRARYRVEPGISLDVMTIHTSSRRASQAADAANAVATAFVEVRRADLNQRVESAKTSLRAALTDIQAQLIALDRTSSASSASARRALEEEAGVLKQRLDVLAVTTSDPAFGYVPGAPATAPRSAEPRPIASHLTIAFATGLMLALLVVQVKEGRRRTRITTDADVIDAVEGLDLLATLPGGEGGLAFGSDKTDAADAFRLLSIALESQLPAEATRVQITGVKGDCPAGWVAANLGAALDADGRRVVIADLDMKGGQQAELLAADANCTIADALAGRECDQLAVASGLIPSIGVIVSGSVADAAAALSDPRVGEILKRAEADRVIIDGEPVLEGAGASIASRYCDVSVIVARRNKTKRRDLNAAVDRLRKANATLAGVVLVD